MRAVASAASFAALFVSFGSGPAAACYGPNCPSGYQGYQGSYQGYQGGYQGGYRGGYQGGYQGGYFPVGSAVQGAPPLIQGGPPPGPYYQQPPVVQSAPIYQQPIYQAPPVVVQQQPIFQQPAIVQAPPVVVQQAPTFIAPPVRHAEPCCDGPRGRTVYYERGPEILTSYREYRVGGGWGCGGGCGGGCNGSCGGGGYYAEPSYYSEPVLYDRPYWRPYPRVEVCSGGAYETGQAICGMRP